jgi:hypothetical protein
MTCLLARPHEKAGKNSTKCKKLNRPGSNCRGDLILIFIEETYFFFVVATTPLK